jgi:uncharacterized membrane protein
MSWCSSHEAASARGGASDRPIDIARRRYAAGEITKEQYEELRHDLSDRAA